MTTPGNPKLAYRRDIDGLRAIAVLGVLFFHAGLGFPGGYVGVDVFFVISGFLITSLLLKDLRAGTFSILDFWERRARRILPALAVVVAAVLIAGWFLLLPDDYEALGKQVIALVAFSSNIKFWRETGYFASAAEEKPLLHTWSLSLEEQFYLLIPLFLAFLFRIRKSGWVFPLLIAGSIVSFVLSIYGSHRAPDANFFLLPTRAWELAAGSLVVFAAPLGRPFFRNLLSWVGAAAVVAPFFLYTADTRFPGLSALSPVAGAALLIWSGMTVSATELRPLPHRILAAKPFVWVGLLSYSLYLWHWPLFAFNRYLSFEPPTLSLRLGLVAASFVLAWLSLRFVEQPFRSRETFSSRATIFGLSGATMAAMVFASGLIWYSDGALERLPREAQNYAAAKDDSAFIQNLDGEGVPGNLIPFGASNGSPSVFVWGDSHGMAILPAVDAACAELGLTGRAATASSTAPLLDWYKVEKYGLNENAPKFNAAVYKFISSEAAKRKTSHVLLVARWKSYLADPNQRRNFIRSLENTVKQLQASGCRVTLVLTVPAFSFDPPRALALTALWSRSTATLGTTRRAYLDETAVERQLFAALESKGVALIDPDHIFPFIHGKLSPIGSDGILHRDSHHLSTVGAMLFKRRLVDLLAHQD